MTQAEILGPFASLTDLVAAMQMGETAAAEQLYRVLAGSFKGYFARRMPAELVEDAVHDCYLSAATKIREGALREPERLLGFLRAIARHQFADFVAQSVFRRNRTQLIDEGAGTDRHSDRPFRAPADQGSNPETRAINKDKRRMIERTLASLRPPDADLLRSYYLLEQSEEEIALRTGLTLPQLRHRRTQALSRFAIAGRRLVAGLPVRRSVLVMPRREKSSQQECPKAA